MSDSIEPYKDKGIIPLLDMAAAGSPQTVDELKDRIRMYFEWAESVGRLPMIEQLSLSLGIDRSTFWRWCSGKNTNKDREWMMACKAARQVCLTALEQAAQDGTISAPVSIFLLKNYGYSDVISFEGQEIRRTDGDRKPLMATDLPRLGTEDD